MKNLVYSLINNKIDTEDLIRNNKYLHIIIQQKIPRKHVFGSGLKPLE